MSGIISRHGIILASPRFSTTMNVAESHLKAGIILGFTRFSTFASLVQLRFSLPLNPGHSSTRPTQGVTFSRSSTGPLRCHTYLLLVAHGHTSCQAIHCNLHCISAEEEDAFCLLYEIGAYPVIPTTQLIRHVKEILQVNINHNHQVVLIAYCSLSLS